MKSIGNLIKGKSFTERGERRYALAMWQFASIAMLGITIFIVYRDGKIMKELATQQYSVYEVDRRGNVTMHSAEEYQVGPLAVEIEGKAIEVARWIVKADSNDVDTARSEARRVMTEDMARDFDAKRGDEWAEKIKKLNIYRIIDEINARPLKPEDLPAEDRNKVRITKYDMVVFGKVQTYRRGTGDWLDESKFAIHVTLQPQEARTKDNMSALLVDLMTDLDANQIMGVKTQSTVTPTPAQQNTANTNADPKHVVKNDQVTNK